MKDALERLGFGPCYHMTELMAHPDQVDGWMAVAGGEITTRQGWDRVLAGYRATQDWPASHYWRELSDAYPEAKVLLTVRDPHTWYLSIRMLMSGDSRPEPSPGLAEPMRRALDSMERMRPMLNRIGQSHFGPDWHFGADMTDEAHVIAAFDRHVTTVRESIPPERLLVFDVREGWGPLCAFLGVAVPNGEPFPHLNDAQTMRRTFERISAGDPTLTPLSLFRR
jgi:hypothetical protein